MYDTIIIGAGPSGLTAGLFAARKGLSVLIFDNAEQPSNLELAYEIENYPGIEKIRGHSLLEKIRNQVKKNGCDIINEKVLQVKNIGEKKVVVTESKKYEAKTIIFAIGLIHRKANINNEERFIGKGVSYCISCDGPLFKNKNVVVVGGGNSAVNGALSLLNIAKNVTLIHRRDKLRADEVLVKRIKKSKIKLILNSVVKKIEGNSFVSEIELENLKTGKLEKIKTDGIFIEIGYDPADKLTKDLNLELDENGFIIVDQKQRTNINGVFAAGDVTNNPLKQIITACADGAKAANSAYEHIKNVK